MASSKTNSGKRLFEPDERQREAIEHVHGPMLVVAGAGTGKTTVLTQRIARLVREGHARPDEILAVTYTLNSAAEMRARVKEELQGIDITGLQTCTFHDYCFDLLKRSRKGFDVLDEKELWIFLRRRIDELNLKHFIRPANLSRFLDDLLEFIRRCQDELITPEKYAHYVQRLCRGEVSLPRVGKSKDADQLSDEDIRGRCQEIANVFTTVEHMLREENLGTFGHMITEAYELLHKDAGLLESERKRTRFILVDEFQDSNFAQMKILQMLAGEERNVFAVGDPDQAIYRFRGGSSAAFTLFQRHFPSAKTVVLGKNRRSTTPILQCSFALIRQNPDIFPNAKDSPIDYRRAPLQSARAEAAAAEGRPLKSIPMEAMIVTDNVSEASEVVTNIRLKKRQLGCKWKDFAVLYRIHSHRPELVYELTEQGIPFSIENLDVMDTAEARDLFACLGAVVSLNDGISLFRVAALPQFGINPQQFREAIRQVPRDQQSSGIAIALGKIPGGSAVLETVQDTRVEIAHTGAKALGALEIILRRFALDSRTVPITVVLDFVLSWERKPKALTRDGKLEDLVDYLDYYAAARGTISVPTRDEDAVRLMTPHAAKGLEFNHVSIIRVSQQSFPSTFAERLIELPRELQDPDSVVPGDDKELHNQEERRLFYVAMTRARDSLTIYAKRSRKKDDPSPPVYMRELLADRSLKGSLILVQPRGFQTDLFAEAQAARLSSRTTDWLNLPPATDLSARLSASSVQRYEICPLQFKLEREWRIPGEVGAAMQYGASMHRVLREYYESIRLKQPIPDDVLLDLFRSDLAQAGLQEEYQHKLYQEQGIAQLTEFLATCKRNPAPDVLQTEQFFEVKIGDTVVVGRIDRMDRTADGRVVITDYKTGRPQTEDDATKSLQLTIYALAAREKWGYTADSLVLYNLGENTAVATQRSPQQLQAAAEKVKEVATEVAAGKFEANPGFHCSYCAYRSLCPIKETRLYSISTEKNSGRSAS